MNQIRSVQALNQRELDAVTPPSASWHTDHRNSAFIYIGGLDARLSEGDVIVIFSQYGQPNYLNLPRDKETGKPRGFAFLRYADQRSTDLAVDNLGGADVLGRKLRVDHCEYKVREGERVWDNTYGSEGEDDPEEMKGSGSENEGEKRPVLKEERELEKLIREHDEEDPLKSMLVQEKREEVRGAIERWEKEQAREKRREKGRRRHRRVEDDRRDEDCDGRYRRRERSGSQFRHYDEGHKRRRRGGGDSSARDDGNRENRRGHVRPVSSDSRDGHRERRRGHTRSQSSDSRDDRRKRRVSPRRRSPSRDRRRHERKHEDTTTTGVETAPIDLQRESADIPTSTEDEEATIDGHQSIADKEAIVAEQQSIGDEESAIDK
ncbi:MAG: hypothetical protein Q9159_006869 [Coniocarpon cinnabarinum]